MGLKNNRGELRRLTQSNFFRYVLIGGFAATLDLLVFIFLYNTIHLNPTISTVISTSVGIITSFLLNAFLNFKKRNVLLKRFVLFYLTGVVGLMISAAVIHVAHDRLLINANIAKLLSIPLVVAVQFVLNKRFSFSGNLDKDYDTLKFLLLTYYKTALLLLISAAAFFSAVFANVTLDDLDNILGGKLILEGIFPYSGFFSHHAPGMYFLSSLVYPFAHDNVFVYRVIFNIFAFGALLTTYFLLKRRTTAKSAAAYLILMSVGHLVAISHVPLGESMVAQLLPLVAVLVFLRGDNSFSLKELLILSLLLFLVPFMSLVYIFPALVFYAVIAVKVVKNSFYMRSYTALLQLLVLAIPYSLFLIIIVLTGYRRVYADLFIFNSEYYAPMVGEQGGGLWNVLTAILSNNIAQIMTLITNIFTLKYLTQTLLVVGFIFFCIYLWKKNKRTEAGFVPLLPLLLSTRTNTFNHPAITADLSSLSQHAAPYIGMALLVGSVGVLPFINQALRGRHYNKIFGMIAVAYFIIIPTVIFGIWVKSMDSVFISKTKPNYLQYSLSLPRSNEVILLNQLTSPADSVWVGPADFGAQLYVDAKRATRFSFYLPWIDASPDLRKEFTSSLKNEQPKVIVFWGYRSESKEYNYSNDLESVFQENYFQVKDRRLKVFYFNKQDRASINKELKRLNYETE
jgi:putative flippase GtrA